MRILYKNELFNATLTATSENTAYPVENVIDPFLEKVFRPASATAVTILFPKDTLVSCIAVGLQTVDFGAYLLKDSGGSSLLSGALALNESTDMTYFAETSCRSIHLSFAGAGIQIGGISAGVPIEVEHWNVNPRFDYYTRDKNTITRGGQSIGYKTAPLLRYRATLGAASLSLRNELWAMTTEVGSSTPIYFDLYELDHTVTRPIYCIFKGDGKYVRDSRSQDFSTTLVFEEVN